MSITRLVYKKKKKLRPPPWAALSRTLDRPKGKRDVSCPMGRRTGQGLREASSHHYQELNPTYGHCMSLKEGHPLRETLVEPAVP